MSRPRIAILGRFTDQASALRYRGVVSSRALLDLVWAAGGDPVTLLPGVDEDALDWTVRLTGFSGVLLPGGGDVHPDRYGGDSSNETVYGVDLVQDEADFSLTRHCLDNSVPILAVCRGLHVLNVVLGGSLVVDMPSSHRQAIQRVELQAGADRLGVVEPSIEISCYHHQAIDRLGDRMEVLARTDDGTIEAVAVSADAWTAGVQWHPEDTWTTDDQQVLLVRAFVKSCR